MKTLAEVRAGLDSGAKEICGCGDTAHCQVCHSRKLIMLAFDHGAKAVMEHAQKLVEALEFYSDPDDWNQFISSGNIFDEVDGDFVSAFNKGEDTPFVRAKEALREFKEWSDK